MQAKFNQGLELHQQGNLAGAERIYCEVLEKLPNHFDALHLLGVIAHQARQSERAVELITKAIGLNPKIAATHNNCGLALQGLRRTAEAVASYDKAIALKPDYAEAYNNRGNALRELNRPAEALASCDRAIALKPSYAEAYCSRGNALQDLRRLADAVANYDKVIALKPDYAEAHNNRGVALQDLKCLAEAVASYDRAIALRPDYAEAHNNRGVALQDLKRLVEAVASYDRAVALRPDYAEAHNNRGNALRESNQPVEALASCDRAIALKPSHAGAFNSRGNVLRDLNCPAEALASYDRAIALKPDYADACNNRGIALRNLNRLDEALESYDRAISLKPDHAEAYSNRGNVLRDLSRPVEALASYERAIVLKPDHAEALFNRSFMLLLMGDLLSGWPGYESRWHRSGAAKKKLIAPWPEWKGQEIRNKSILVYEEQGLGDTIQFSRYLTRLSSSGAQVTFLVRAAMHRVLESFTPAIRLIDAPPRDARFDFQAPLLSLPGASRTTLDTIPADCPYLFAEQPLIKRWQDRVGTGGFRIGICWQGNPDVRIDIGRSIPLRSFYPVACIPGVRMISLQKNHGLDQLFDLPVGMTVESLGEDFDSGSDAFIDTAAVMSNLDLIITSDTSVAHLAGALGRPVWLILKSAPDWRWMLDREDTPWYSSMRLFRQSSPHSWFEVFEQVASSVRDMTA